MLTVQSVSEAAALAAMLSWICAVGFLVCYALDLRRVFRHGHSARPRSGRSDLFAFHLVVVHNDPAADVRRTLGDLVELFPHARVWVMAGAAPLEPEIDPWAPDHSPWQVITADGADPLVRIRDAIAREASANGSVDGSAHADPRRVVIGLLESGSRPEPDLPERLAARGLFADRRIGAVQVARHVDLAAVPATRRATPSGTAQTLLRAQDLEERGPVSAAQLARSGSGTAILGGAGQFFRLSALTDALAARAARTSRPSAREVLDGRAVTTGLWAASWATAYANDTAITGRGISSLRAYVDERRQLAATALAGLGALLALRGRGAARSLASLAGPALAPLACVLATLIAIVGLTCLTATALANPGAAWSFVSSGGWAVALALAVIALGEFVVWGVAYGLRQAPTLGPIRGAGLGMAYVVLGLAQVVAVWAAVIELVQLRFAPQQRTSGGRVGRPRDVPRRAVDVPLRPGDVPTPGPTAMPRTPDPVTIDTSRSPWLPPGGVGISVASADTRVRPEPAPLARRHDRVGTDSVRHPAARRGAEARGPVAPRRVRVGVAVDAPSDRRPAEPVAGSGRHRA